MNIYAEISDFFEDLMYDRGKSPLLGRIYALCVLTDPINHIHHKELIQKFNVNPSTISRILKNLESWGLLDRRREPGSREWKYHVEPSSFLDLFLYQFEKNSVRLRSRRKNLRKIREDWMNLLSEKSNHMKNGNRAFQVLDFLIE